MPRTLDVNDGDDLSGPLANIEPGTTVTIPDGEYRLSNTQVSGDSITIDGQGATIVPTGRIRLTISGAGFEFGRVRFKQDADGIGVQLNPSGVNWRVHNVAWTGSHDGVGNYLLTPEVTSSGAQGIVDACYNDCDYESYPSQKWNAWLWVNHDHYGELIVRNSFSSGGGVYGTHSAEDQFSTEMGVTHVENSYFDSNNIHSIRTGHPTKTCRVEDCVINIDPDRVPSQPAGAKNGRGIWSWYGETVVTNTDVNQQGTWYAAAGHYKFDHQGTIDYQSGNIVGNVDGNVTVSESVGDTPATSPPDGVPTTAMNAAGGTPGGPPPDGGGGDDPPPGGDENVTTTDGLPSFETRRVGLDDIPDNLEPPAAEVTVHAWVTPETFAALNALRDRDEPFDLAVGDFTLTDVGITDLTVNVDGGTSGLDVAITVKEHRVSYVQAPTSAGGGQREQDGEETPDDTPADDYLPDDDTFPSVPDATTDTTVNLGDEGLQDGDELDQYFADYVESGARVEIPGGSYTWTGDGLSGQYQDAALVGVAAETSSSLRADGGTDRVYIDASAATGPDPAADIEVTGGGAGSFHLANVTFTGARTAGPVLVVRATDPDASLLLRRVNLPDGGTAGRAAGIVVPSDHVGTAYIRNCYVRGFPNCGVLAGDATGAVRVEGGLYRNNNVAGIELGTDDSRVELATIVNDQPAPEYDGQRRTQRGLWFSDAATGVQAVDCDVYHDVASGAPIVAADGPTLSGAVRNCRITNESSRPAARIHNDISFEGVHLTGGGNLSLKGAAAACSGSGCDAANWSTDETDAHVELDERVLAPDEVRRVTLGDDDVLAGVVFDQSADGARVELVADGSGWAIENVAIVGRADGQNQHATITPAAPSGASGRIENVYMADGAHAGSGLTGLRTLAHHAGHVTVRECNIQRYPDIGIHTHRPGASNGAGGTVTVDGCYLAHNGTANVTLGTAGTSLQNSVVYSDASGPSDTSQYRGVWGWYHDTDITNSDVYTGPSAGPGVVGGHHGGSVTMTNGALHGGAEGAVTLTNVGSVPDSVLPAAVPDSPVQAVGQS